MNKKSTLLFACLSIIICLLIEFFFFGGFLTKPNAYMFPFGGDGYFITYNMNFHAQHGEGIQLNSMNHPYGEVIFMTDANGVISLIVQQLREWELPVEHMAMGFMNAANYYLIPLCVLFLFLIFRQLKLPGWYAMLSALFIGLLSPQLLRIVCGHYALGFPFLLPMVIYWVMRASNKRSWYVGGFFVGLTLLLFGLNNFYLLLIGAGFCFLIGLICFFRLHRSELTSLSRPLARRQSIVMMLVGFLPLLIGFIINESLSTHSDRVRVPFGFMRDFELLPSLVWAERSFILDHIASKAGLRPSGIESMSYLGMVPLIIFLVAVFRGIKGRFYRPSISKNPYFNIVFISGLIFLLLAAHFPFYGPLRELGNQLPVLPQFRAEQRLIWAFYFAFTILMMYKGYHYWHTLNQKRNKLIPITVLGLGIALCAFDVNHYLDSLNNEIFFENHFSESRNEQMLQFAKENDLNLDNYQGIYMLPTMNGWTDKVYHDGHWATYFHGMRLCVATGIPMVNQMLSRVSVEQALQNLQFVSHPIIERDKIIAFPDKRPILICRGDETPIHPHEEWLISQGDTVAQGFNMTLLAYDPWDDDSYEMREEAREYARREVSEDSPIISIDFDDMESPHLFYGDGAAQFDGSQDPVEVWSGDIPDWPTDTTYEASIWVYPDRDREGLPHWYLQQLNEAGQTIAQVDQSSVKSYDTQQGWVRATMNFDLLPETTSLKLLATHPTDFWCDEFLVRSVRDTVFREVEGESTFMWNNFLIKHE
ncbi:MAG: hypothetical protein AAF741_11360 [Bacteroidota bacterium]